MMTDIITTLRAGVPEALECSGLGSLRIVQVHR